MGAVERYQLREETWTGPDGEVRLGRIWQPAAMDQPAVPSTTLGMHPERSRRMHTERADEDGSGRMQDQPRAVISLVHGLGEHSGRYAVLGETLAARGIALVSADLGGFGRSGGRRGHNSVAAIMQEIDKLLEVSRDQFPGRPAFLYGHSLGGIIVLYYLLKRKEQGLAGAVVTSAGLRSQVQEQKAKVWAARLGGSLLPGLALPSGLEVGRISRDPEVVQRYKDDPLVHDRISLGLGKEMMDVIPWIFAHAGELNLPLLLMHGTADQLAYASGSEEFAARAPANRVTLQLWPGMAHELHNEPEKEEVFAFLLDWLDALL